MLYDFPADAADHACLNQGTGCTLAHSSCHLPLQCTNLPCLSVSFEVTVCQGLCEYLRRSRCRHGTLPYLQLSALMLMTGALGLHAQNKSPFGPQSMLLFMLSSKLIKLTIPSCCVMCVLLLHCYFQCNAVLLPGYMPEGSEAGVAIDASMVPQQAFEINAEICPYGEIYLLAFF
jgi:hypothetical protein